MNYITDLYNSKYKIPPYNTGKVRIGEYYTQPAYIDTPTPTMYRLQTALLENQQPRSNAPALIRALTDAVSQLIRGGK